MNMIRLTLPDGTRTQIEASEVTDVESVPGGSLVHRAAGDPIKVMQNSRTLQARINAELDVAAIEVEADVVPIVLGEAAPTIAVIKPKPTIEPAVAPASEPAAGMRRLRRLMQGRISAMALTIGQMRKR